MFKRVFFVIYKFGQVCAIHIEAQSLVDTSVRRTKYSAQRTHAHTTCVYAQITLSFS